MTDQQIPQERRPTSVVVVLDEPIKRGDQVINQVTLRKPDSGALRGVTLLNVMQMDTDTIKKVLPRITDPILTTADVGNLDVSDLVAIASEVAGFLLTREQRAVFQDQ